MARLSGFLSILLVASLHSTSAATADTFLVLPGPKAPKGAPAVALGSADVGERYCNPARCVVLGSTDAHRAQLDALAEAQLIHYQPITDADKLKFQNATWDSSSDAFMNWFPGAEELPRGDSGLFGVVFKSYLEPGWLDTLVQKGFTPVEPLPVMGYLVYGPRAKVAPIMDMPQVKAVLEIPAGLKRQSVDDLSAGDAGGAISTTVAFVGLPKAPAEAWIAAKSGGHLPAQTYAMGLLRAYTLPLTREQAMEISRYAEVVGVHRSSGIAAPSDERTNRILSGGEDLVTDPPWPSALPLTNDNYWNRFVAHLAEANPGFNLDNQVIGFLDEGVAGPDGHTNECPDYLNPTNCRLVFRADVSNDHFVDSMRAREVHGHGTLTTAIAAGYHTASDTHGYSFTKGVATGARIAMAKVFHHGVSEVAGACETYGDNEITRSLGNLRRDMDPSECEGVGHFTNGDMGSRVRYALVELGSDILLPDQDPANNDPTSNPPTNYEGGQQSPHAQIINHSWNDGTRIGTYDDVSLLLDQTARDASLAQFTFVGPTVKNAAPGSFLHVVSAGNWTGTGDRTITAPGLAKNALTVGATPTYNQESYTTSVAGGGNEGLCAGGTPAYNSIDANSDPRSVAGFSRFGPSLGCSMKPEVVAPGSRAYGPTSTALGSQLLCNVDCYWDIGGTNAYAWSVGTSFSAPAVSGAAALLAEWHRSLLATYPFDQTTPRYVPGGANSVSPAFLRAAVVAGAVRIGDVAPNNSQGFGGLALDKAFHDPAWNYYYDQRTVLTPQDEPWVSRPLVPRDPNKPVAIILTWTDRPSYSLPSVSAVNELMLNVEGTNSDFSVHEWYGNLYSGQYSVRDPRWALSCWGSLAVAGVTISPNHASMLRSFTIHVIPHALNGDGINAAPCDPPCMQVARQDFAVVAYNVMQQ